MRLICRKTKQTNSLTSCPTKPIQFSLPYYLLKERDGFIPFPRVFMQSECKQPQEIFEQLTNFILLTKSHYATCTPKSQ